VPRLDVELAAHVVRLRRGPAQVLLGHGDGVDDRGLRLRDVSVRDRMVVVRSLGYRPEDPNAAGASVPVTDEFTWDGARFVRGPRRTGS
jgi:hypothetical protein